MTRLGRLPGLPPKSRNTRAGADPAGPSALPPPRRSSSARPRRLPRGAGGAALRGSRPLSQRVARLPSGGQSRRLFSTRASGQRLPLLRRPSLSIGGLLPLRGRFSSKLRRLCRLKGLILLLGSNAVASGSGFRLVGSKQEIPAQRGLGASED